MGSAENLMSPKQALAVAEDYVRDTIEIMNVGRSDPRFAPVIDQLRAGMTGGGEAGAQRVRVLLAQLRASAGDDASSFMGVSVQTAEAAKLWRQHRVVYRVHPGLAESLVETETQTAVPCEIFSRLPHPDPFVAFPTPLTAPIAKDGYLQIAEPPMIVGMLITGANQYEQVCSTADPQVRRLNIALATRVRYEGQPVSHEEATAFVPLDGKRSIEDLIDLTTAWPTFGQVTRDEQRSIYNLALSLLLYLCSDRRDARAYRPNGRRGKKNRRPDQKLIDLGFNIGPSLHAARRIGSPPAPGGEGVRVKAHIRRAHWHTYWTGPRSAPTPEVRWLHPTLVHKDEFQGRATLVDVTE
ncbi:hypothetical protein [Nocardia testacea]|uniref:hypothetical protein n=1 Tax=Nocardia testacea TaxID=248551 RepID=UPI0033C82B57